ncbi:alpha/beta fold hydrolase [Salinarimonas soli]|uniref:Alpha/beta hydrolase n=1 Tax=Salinarimonas soli TaxID=1638099 RepID=A0A5B2VDX5_9HYPH|nr:alpha/beta hydrolase [Salinarimonas soli]KAA2236559.1 alpha/beta hydrolase [Salinarimonas soli]
MELVPTPDNPVPDGAEILAVKTRDGLSLRTARWAPAGGEVRGTVLLLQGRAEFIEKYFETIGDLLARDLAVVTFDWRGQGGSDREVPDPRRGHVRRFSDYALDLEAVVEQVMTPSGPRPWFVLAHSMGAAIALDLARRDALPVERLVALAPMIRLSMIRAERWPPMVAQALWALGLGKQYIPGGGATSIATKPFAGNRLTGDPVRYARNATSAAAVGPGAIGDPTVGWLHAAFRFMARFTETRAPLEIRLPTLVVAAGNDPVCSTPAIERFAARLKAGHALVLRGARHEILMESDPIRRQFWAAFDAFIPGTPDRSFAPPDTPTPAEAATG